MDKLNLLIDKNRMEQEMIYYIEKLDINEEVIRLNSHLKLFKSELNNKLPIGKKLGFISQEIGREINTLGAKANDPVMQKMVIEMKHNLEKIKENVFKYSLMSKNKFIIIAAPSGSGKSSIVNMLLNDNNLKLNFSTSATTRPKRVNEVDGKNYYFFSKEKFKKKIKNNEFVEWEEVYKDTFYGTLISELENTTKNIVFDIDVIGGLNIKKLFPNKSLTIFIKPPSIEELEVRLRARMSDNESSIIERVQKAKLEMQSINKFDHVVENNILDDCYREVSNIVYNFVNDK